MEDPITSNTNYTISKRIVLNILYTQQVLNESFNELLKPLDLSQEQFNVLRILRGAKEATVNMNVIQERMIAKTSNTTRLVDKLLLKDYVTRSICPSNRRKMEVAITQKGLDVLKQLDPQVEQHEQQFAKTLAPQEQEQLNNLLEKYRGANKSK